MEIKINRRYELENEEIVTSSYISGNRCVRRRNNFQGERGVIASRAFTA